MATIPIVQAVYLGGIDDGNDTQRKAAQDGAQDSPHEIVVGLHRRLLTGLIGLLVRLLIGLLILRRLLLILRRLLLILRRLLVLRLLVLRRLLRLVILVVIHVR